MGQKHIHPTDIDAGIAREDNEQSGDHDGTPGQVVPIYKPDAIVDSLEDKIREAAMPLTLSDTIVANLVAVYEESMESPERLEKTEKQIALEVIKRVFKVFTIREWSILDWWAIHFAVETDDTDGTNCAMAADMLGITRARFHWRIQKWRKRFGIPTNKHSRAEGKRLSWKNGRHKQRIRAAKEVAHPFDTSQGIECQYHPMTDLKKQTCSKSKRGC